MHKEPLTSSIIAPGTPYDAERIIIATCLEYGQDHDETLKAISSLPPQMFGVSVFREAWGIMQELTRDGKRVDIYAVGSLLRGTNVVSALEEVNQTYCTPINLGIYIGEAMRAWQERRVAGTIERLQSSVTQARAHHDDDAMARALSVAQCELSDIGASPMGEREPVSAAILLERAIRRLEDIAAGKVEPPKVRSTGLRSIDDVTNGGLRPGQLAIIAARPGVGKTALATSMALAAARSGEGPALFFSLEMSNEEVTNRLLSQVACEDLTAIIQGTLTPERAAYVAGARRYLQGLALYLDDSPTADVAYIAAAARKAKARAGTLSLVVVDYLQLMPSTGSRAKNREQEVAEATRALKLMAKELGCPVVALSQLSRAVETSDGKEPQLWHLRESGAIEQDADVVMLLWHNEDEPVHKCKVAKHRNGPTGTAELIWTGRLAKFASR